MVETALLWREQDLGSSESLISNQDFSAIWKLVIFLACMTLLSLVFGSFVVIDNIAHFLLDVLDDFDFCISGEAVSSLIKNLLEMVSNISTSKMNSLNSMWNSVTFINRHSVGNAIT